MTQAEKIWRDEADRLPPSALRTEAFEELRSMLALRETGDLETPEKWLSEMEDLFESEYARSEEESEEAGSQDEPVLLAELFISEGVESWLEAFHLFREGAPEAEVLEAAEEGQRMLVVVQVMARGAM